MSDTKDDTQLPLGINIWWGEAFDKDGKPLCIHKWVKYEGFTDTYEFCEKCDEKRTLTEEYNYEKSGTNTKRTF